MKSPFRGKKPDRALVALNRITTRTGDGGSTGLSDGTRLKKDHPRIEALGAVDELNAWMGWLRALPSIPARTKARLGRIQNDLFDLGAGLSRVPGKAKKERFRISLSQDSIADLEDGIAQLNRRLPPLRSFVLPGGNQAAALCHVARTVCRRAERRLVSLGDPSGTNRIFLNRLSDFLFVLSRILGPKRGGGLWSPRGGLA